MNKSRFPSRRLATVVQFIGNQSLLSLAIVRGIVLVPFYIEYIGEEVYGGWLALGGAVLLLGLFDLGISNLISQRTALYSGSGDYNSLGKLLATIISFILGAMALMTLVSLIVVPILPSWIGFEGEVSKQLEAALWVATADLILTFGMNVTGAILFGLQRPFAVMLGMFISTALSIIVTAILLFQGWGVLAIPSGSIVRSSLSFIVNSIAIFFYFRKKLKRHMFRLERSIFHDFFKAALWLGPANMAETLTLQFDNIVVAKLLHPIEVTVLTLTRKVAELMIQLVGRVSASFLSGLAHLQGTREEDKFRSIVEALFRITIYLAGVFFGGVLLLNGDFVALWTGPDLFGGQLLTMIICLYSFIKVVRITLYNTVFARGEIHITSLALLTEAFIQGALGIFWSSIWGIKGVVWAGVLAVTVGSIIQATGLFRILHIKPQDVAVNFLNMMPAIILPILVGWCVHWFWQPNRWSELILFATGYLLVAIIVILAYEPDFRNFMQNRIILMKERSKL